MTKLTIGITFYNRLNELKNNLDILLNECDVRVQIIVINDNPHIKLSKEDFKTCGNHLQIINNDINIGEYSCFRKLLEISKTEYFTWLADDDFYEKGLLTEIINLLCKSNVDIIFTKYKLRFNNFLKNGNNLVSVPHREILQKKLNSVSLYCIYKIEILKKITETIRPFTKYNIALYFEYALLINLQNIKYYFFVINNKKIIINNSNTSWSASNSDINVWRDGFKNLLIFCKSKKNIDIKLYNAILKIIINDQIGLMRRTNLSIFTQYFSTLFFLFSNIKLLINKYYIIPYYILISLLYSLKIPYFYLRRNFE